MTTDRRSLHDILDAGLLAHVAVVRDGAPVVLPFAYARRGDELLLHGSTGAALLRAAAGGAPVAVAVTLVDGLVFADSLFDSTMLYRSVVVVGTGRVLTGDDELSALRALSEHLMPGRWDEVRPPTRKELAGTLVLALPLAGATVAVRARGVASGPGPGGGSADWVGVLPLAVRAGDPEPGADTSADRPVPPSVAATSARFAPPPGSDDRGP